MRQVESQNGEAAESSGGGGCINAKADTKSRANIQKSLGDRVWSQPTRDATEDEVRDFLYGLVRLIKPKVCLEMGSHCGDGTKRLGGALKANGMGYLWSCDVELGMVERAREVVVGLPVEVEHCSGFELAGKHADVDFAFIDSGRERFQEAKAIRFAEGAYCVLHDAKQQEYPGLEAFRTLGWKDVTFDTPVGLALFQI